METAMRTRVNISLVLLPLLFAASSVASHAAPGVFVVTTTADTGAGSLRQAILDANTGGSAAAINFNIPGTGPFIIKPATNFPNITVPITIDGYTEPGASANTLAAGDNAVL